MSLEYIAGFRPEYPYNFPAYAQLLSHFPHPTVDIVIEGGVWHVMHHDQGLALMVIQSVGTVEGPELEVYLAAETGETDTMAVMWNLRLMLAVEEMRHVWYMAEEDEVLWPILKPLYGMPSTRTETPFEALAMTIIEQHISWKAARRAQRWLVEWADESLSYDGQTFYAFPTPARIARASIDELKPLKITDLRIRLLISVAQQIESGKLDFSELRDLPRDFAYEELSEIKGIGHWTAAVTLARAFGWRDFIPDNDAALQAAVNHYFYGEPGRASAERVTETLERYGAFAGDVADMVLSRWVIDFY